MHAHNEQESADWVVDAVRDGECVAYVTDAGMPGISDPGERLVRVCVDAGLRVDVVPGPSAVLMALVLSGFPTDRFVFEGFLPAPGRGAARAHRRARARAAHGGDLRVAEPVHATLTQLLGACGPLREVAVARELTKLHQEVWRGPLDEAVGHVALTEPRASTCSCSGRRRPRPRPTTTRSTPTSPPRWPRASRRATPPPMSPATSSVPRRRTYDAAIRLKPSANACAEPGVTQPGNRVDGTMADTPGRRSTSRRPSTT